MIGIKVNNEFLNLDKGSSFIYNASSPLFLAGEMDKILTSFTSEFKIPLTPANRKILGYPDAIDQYASLMTDADCDLYYLGMYMFSGYATVTEISSKDITLKVVINPYKAIKDTPLKDVVNDTFYFASVEEIKLHAKTTSEYPDNYDHIFFPVFNENWRKVGVSDLFYAFQNRYDLETEEYITDSGKAAMPFVKLKYILEKIVAAVDFIIDNQFQVDELELLCVFNNFSIYKEDEWGDQFSYSNHVPDITSSDFFKNVVKTFCLAAIPDFIERKIVIKSVNSILENDTVVDWTNFAKEDYQLLNDTATPCKVKFANDCYYTDIENNEYYYITNFIEVDKYSEIGSGDGIYYVRSRNRYYQKIQNKLTKLKKQFNRYYISPNNNSDFELMFSPLYQEYMDTGVSFQNCRYKGITLDDEGDAGQVPSLHLMIYRGMVDKGNGKLYPFANNSIFDNNENVSEDYQYSLDFTGTNGLYEKFWKNWIHFLLHRKIVVMKFVLTFQKFLEFSFEKKIRVGNMLYFCNNFKAAFSSGEYIEIEAEMSTILSS